MEGRKRGGGGGGGGSGQEDSLYIKGARKKKHVNLLNKEEGCREREKRGAWMKVETITFSFGQVFVCMHACKEGEGGGGDRLCAG